MKVVPFRRPFEELPHDWRSAELREVADACAPSISRGEIDGWDIGVTEAGDPQLYLLGPAPNYDCVMCISRLGQFYVLEDGNGHVVAEYDSMSLLAAQVRAVLRRGKAAIAARVTALGCAIRELFEEKIEPVLAEPAEILAHFVPQIEALA